MASQELINKAIEAFENDDDFGKKCTLHSLGLRTKEDFYKSLPLQEDWRLEILIDDIID